MELTVKLFATLRAGRFKEEKLSFPPGTTVALAIARLGIPEKELALVMINGLAAEPDTQLSDGDVLALFPPVGGG